MFLNPRSHRFKPRFGEPGFRSPVLTTDLDPTLVNKSANCHLTNRYRKVMDHLPVGHAKILQDRSLPHVEDFVGRHAFKPSVYSKLTARNARISKSER
jgi:hypothetical protein